MWIIITLIILGVLLLVAELVFLPGISVAGFCALGSYAGAVYVAFNRYGTTGGFIVIAIIIVLSIAATYLSLKADTWKRLSLKQKIDSTSQALPQQNDLKIGDRATSVTRLAPMGKISVDGQTYEAKVIDDFVDQNTEVEIVGFENFSVVVKKITN